MKKVVILQSNHIPWKGYFDLIHDADVCLFYDCVAYTRQDWRNRNQVMAYGRRRWLSVPIHHSHLGTPINQVLIDNRQAWQAHHFHVLWQHYKKAPFFDQIAALIAPYLGEGPETQRYETLSDFNQAFIRALCHFLGVTTITQDSAALQLQGETTFRVLDALKKLGAGYYLSGPSAKNYLDEGLFRQAGINLAYKSYEGYPEYPQFSENFEHQVSILDLLFHVGAQAPRYIWGWRKS